jgi:hypothetical protein
VFESYASGSSIRKISDTSQPHLSVTKVHRIVKSLNEEYRNHLQNAVVTTMPIEYASTIALHKVVMGEALAIAKDNKDSRTKLEALRVVTDCRRYLDRILVNSDKVAGLGGGSLGKEEGQAQTDEEKLEL